jgi:glucosamine--fructose-6-phosphate aminotransferase (isomerizing)
LVFSKDLLDHETVLLAVSRSGEKGFTIDAAKEAKRKGCRVLSVTSYDESLLARTSDDFVQTFEGTEYGNPTTKSFLVQLATLYLIALNMLNGAPNVDKLKKQIFSSPKSIQRIIETQEGKAKRIAENLNEVSSIFLVGGGANFVTAIEGALKVKETSLIHAEGLAIGEYIHGHMLACTHKTPLILIENCGPSSLTSKTVSETVARMGVRIISVVSQNEQAIKKNSMECFEIMDPIDPVLSPLLYVVPLQLLSYYLSVSRGLNPDEPKHFDDMLKIILEPGRVYKEIATRDHL